MSIVTQSNLLYFVNLKINKYKIVMFYTHLYLVFIAISTYSHYIAIIPEYIHYIFMIHVLHYVYHEPR